MKPYLRPRWSGIDTLDIYMEGFGKFLEDRGCLDVNMTPLSGEEPVWKAEEALTDRSTGAFWCPV